MWKEVAMAYLRDTCLDEWKKTKRKLSHYSQFLGTDLKVGTSRTPTNSSAE
jgi:hypothetical protein